MKGMSMKKVILLLTAVALATGLQGQNLLVKGGKTWHESRILGKFLWERTRYIAGDTVINGVSCKKLYERSTRYQIQSNGEATLYEDYPDSFVMGLVEQDGRVGYIQYESDLQPLYDFNLEPGDSLVYMKYHTTFVNSSDSILVNGIMRKRLWVTDTYYRAEEHRQVYSEEWNPNDGDSIKRIENCWVEGIGSATGLTEVFLWPGNQPIYMGNKMVDCYDDGQCIFTESDFSAEPAVTAVMEQTSEIVLLSGRVTNQHGAPVAGATVTLYDTANNVSFLEATTDADGQYEVRFQTSVPLEVVEESLPPVRVSADGYSTFWLKNEVLYVLGKSAHRDFTIFSEATFKAGERSSLVLPVTPDPAAGAYYGFSRVEQDTDKGTQLCFTRVREPEANTPYIFVPENDYTVSFKGLDATPTPRLVSVDDRVFFVSGYESTDLLLPMNFLIMLLDNMPDCHEPTWEEQYYRVGACHGCLIIQDYYKMPRPFSIVLEEATSAVAPIYSQKPDNALYDLQGRRVCGEPRRGGIYISGGRKIVK